MMITLFNSTEAGLHKQINRNNIDKDKSACRKLAIYIKFVTRMVSKTIVNGLISIASLLYCIVYVNM